MLSRLKAIQLYKEMLRDLEEIKRARMHLGDYDGIDLGSVIVTKDRTNSKLSELLAKKAKADGYNFFESPVQSIVDGSIATIFKIDNEPEEVRNKREEEINRRVAEYDKIIGLDRLIEEYDNSNILDLDQYINNKR